jgi:N-formylmaleamate deformylase
MPVSKADLPLEASAERVLTQPALADLAGTGAAGVWVESGPVRLHVLDYGPASAQPLVILPGITSPAISMDFVARALSDVVRPLVLDVRGRGLSDNAPAGAPGPLRGYDLAAYAEDVAAVLDQLRLRAPILLGHSMGARIAAAAAVRDPASVAGVILVDPPMSGPGRPYPTTLAAFLGQLEQARRGTDADEVAHAWPRWARREQELRARWLGSCSRTAIAATHAGFESEEFLPVWTRLTAPAALVFGADSPVVTADDVEQLTRANPGIPATGVENAGHMVFWDAPGRGLDAVRSVLKQF